MLRLPPCVFATRPGESDSGAIALSLFDDLERDTWTHMPPKYGGAWSRTGLRPTKQLLFRLPPCVFGTRPGEFDSGATALSLFDDLERDTQALRPPIVGGTRYRTGQRPSKLNFFFFILFLLFNSHFYYRKVFGTYVPAFPNILI